VYVLVRGVGGQEPTNKRGRGIDPPKSKYRARRLDIAGGVKPFMVSMVVTYGVRYLPLLERLVVENPKSSEAGGLTPKIEYSSTLAPYPLALGTFSWCIQ
jgi:hypothetical protein